jgi:hypothetical protein
MSLEAAKKGEWDRGTRAGGLEEGWNHSEYFKHCSGVRYMMVFYIREKRVSMHQVAAFPWRRKKKNVFFHVETCFLVTTPPCIYISSFVQPCVYGSSPLGLQEYQCIGVWIHVVFRMMWTRFVMMLLRDHFLFWLLPLPSIRHSSCCLPTYLKFPSLTLTNSMTWGTVSRGLHTRGDLMAFGPSAPNSTTPTALE